MGKTQRTADRPRRDAPSGARHKIPASSQHCRATRCACARRPAASSQRADRHAVRPHGAVQGRAGTTPGDGTRLEATARGASTPCWQRAGATRDPAGPADRGPRHLHSRKSAGRAFHATTLVVVPYTQASQSAVGALALGAGVPVVVTSVGSLPELAISEDFVVSPGDSRELASAILRQLDADSESRQRALALARARLSWGVVANSVLTAFRTHGLLPETPPDHCQRATGSASISPS